MADSIPATDIGFSAESPLLALVVDLSPRFRGALQALQSVPVRDAVADEIDLWSAAHPVFVRRELGGELVACVGVDVQVPGIAPSLELCGPKDGAVDTTTLCAKALLPLFGGSLPFGVRPMQLVTVFHHGLDLVEVLGQVPNHAGCLNRVCAHE
jgi:hypothetical protein